MPTVIGGVDDACEGDEEAGRADTAAEHSDHFEAPSARRR